MVIKRGDTLKLLIKRVDEEGDPLTGQAEKMKSQLRTKAKGLITSFEITETEELGTYLFKVSEEITKTFPLGSVLFDIEMQIGSDIVSTETVTIEVVDDITRDVS